jgi:hypothetical protein
MFYAYRYYGISFHRAGWDDHSERERNLCRAEEYYAKAKDCMSAVKARDPKQAVELEARILGNEGNLAETRKQYELAYDLHQHSLRLFESREPKDREHIGSAHWHLAEALLMDPNERDLSKAQQHLKTAELHILALGWREGTAKVYKYESKYYERMAEIERDRRVEHLTEARDAAHKARVLYREMKRQAEEQTMEERIVTLDAMMAGTSQ